MGTLLDTYAPFDSGPGSNVTEATWRKFMRHMLGSASGVIRGFSNEFAVTGDGSGMNVKVATGECWMRGHYGESTAQKTIALAAAHATLPRIDRIILRCDFTANIVEVDRLTGTPSASPVAPAVTQSSTIWETSLALVSVAAADTSITAGEVTDDRVFTSANAKYRRTAGAHPDFSLSNNVTSPYQLLVFAETTVFSGDVRSINGDRFELQRSGLWIVNAKARFAANGSGGREIHIVDYDNRENRYGEQSGDGRSDQNTLLSCVATERFPVGKKISLDAWQNSGGALAVNNMDLTFTWVGP